jgi:hypothetical protein
MARGDTPGFSLSWRLNRSRLLVTGRLRLAPLHEEALPLGLWHRLCSFSRPINDDVDIGESGLAEPFQRYEVERFPRDPGEPTVCMVGQLDSYVCAGRADGPHCHFLFV